MSTNKVIFHQRIPHEWIDLPLFEKSGNDHVKHEKCANCNCVKDTYVTEPPNCRPVTNIKYSRGNLGVWNIAPNCEDKNNTWYPCPQNPEIFR